MTAPRLAPRLRARLNLLTVLFTLAGLILSHIAAGAEQKPARPLVIFFGGSGANGVDMHSWKAAAEASNPYGQLFEFDAFSYPTKVGSDEKKAVVASRSLIESVVTRVASNNDRQVIVVGHSSGAALAATVVERLSNTKRIHLVILDDGVDTGFLPPDGFNSAAQVDCWSARHGPLKSINQVKTARFCSNYHELDIVGCRTRQCLHFRLVNYNAAPDLSFEKAAMPLPDGLTAAYADLNINLDWLKQYQP